MRTTSPQPIASSPALPHSPSSSPRRPWSPSADDHLIYKWVKMDGKSQAEVAGMLNISQPTISRIIQRYERWQAHAREREGGRLDHTERLRAQRWQTFERNELILTSCLRIAKEMEGFVDASKSTIRRPVAKPNQESEVRTETTALDRTGMAARFLRLAFRVNMEQLKLAQLDPPPLANPLSPEELAAEELAAAADAQELLAKVGRLRREQPEAPAGRVCEAQRNTPSSTRSDVPANLPPTTPSDPSPTLNLEPGTLNSAPLNNLHNLHTAEGEKIAATPAEPCSCDPPPRPRKKSRTICITSRDKPQWPGNGKSKSASAAGSARLPASSS